jgi:hypothetical protein
MPTPPRFAVRGAATARGALLRLADLLLPSALAAAEHAHAFSHVHVLATMAELGVADVLTERPQDTEGLARTLDCDSDALHRLLRAAATFGAVRMDRHGRVRDTRLSRTLRSDNRYEIGSWCRFLRAPEHQQAWADLTTTVRDGEPAFRRVHGTDMFTWGSDHPDWADNFTRGLSGLTLAECPFLVGGIDLPSEGVVCDIGGGRGVLLAEILKERPRLRGVLVDSAVVLAGAKAYLDAEGVLSRVTLVDGDMMVDDLPPAELYLLKWVLHDWDGPTCIRLLANVRRAMPPGAKLAVIEGVQEHNDVDPRFSMIDLQMLVVTEFGRERSARELESLAEQAGWKPSGLRLLATGTAILSAG